jgi:hypothetical protein
MVKPLPLLPSNSRGHLAKQNSLLFALQSAAAARGARGIDCLPKSFLCGSDMDKDTRLAIISILEVSREAMKGASEARILTLQIHEALVKARVPGYLEAYESRCDTLFSQLTEVKSKLANVVDAGIQALKENCAR